MNYIWTDDIWLGNSIADCLKGKKAQFKFVSFYFPSEAGEDWVSIWQLRESESVGLLIIAVKDDKKRDASLILIDELGINAGFIFDFCRIHSNALPKNFADKVMLRKKGKSLDGLVLGISHAQVGINTDYMCHEFANLAYSHQDIFYNLQTLRYVVKKYHAEIEKIKYVIIDMFDYYYFNYDVSLSAAAPSFVEYSGASLPPHNFNQNPNVNYTYEQLVVALKDEWDGGISDTERSIWNEYFEDFKSLFANSSSNNWVEDGFVDSGLVENFRFGNLPLRVYEKTIDENVDLFADLLREILAINPNMRIYAILLPRLKAVEELEKKVEIEGLWHPLFEKIMYSFCDKFPNLSFIDMKKNTINTECSFYSDGAHLNRYGAVVLTHKIERMIYSDIRNDEEECL